jgi:hypothetical protein
MLYREAPAHILLRIQWLAPHDFCCFESLYKSWGISLAKKVTCHDEFDKCRFMDFLFHKDFECLEEANICTCCNDETATADECFDYSLSSADSEKKQCYDLNQSMAVDIEKLSFQEQVNCLFYCRINDCDNYTFEPCNPGETACPQQMQYTGVQQKQNSEHTVSVTENISAPEEKTKAAQGELNAYMNARKKEYLELIKGSGSGKVSKSAVNFVSTIPSPAKLIILLKEILADKNTLEKEIKLPVLCKACISCYLDRWSYDKEKKIKELKSLLPVLENLRQSKIDTNSIYTYWATNTINKNNSTADIKQVKKIITGS